MKRVKLNKNNAPKTIIDNEKVMNSDDFIVSKTDTKGFITYCNRIFVEMSGYEKSELLGANHNLIRHPDMPQVAFKLAWDTLKNGKEFFGFVKNLRKNGGYYWVFAYITPDYDSNGNIMGYTSFRRKPSKKAVEVIEPIYKLLRDKASSGGMKASGEFLFEHLKQNDLTYDEFIFNLQKA